MAMLLQGFKLQILLRVIQKIKVLKNYQLQIHREKPQ